MGVDSTPPTTTKRSNNKGVISTSTTNAASAAGREGFIENVSSSTAKKAASGGGGAVGLDDDLAKKLRDAVHEEAVAYADNGSSTAVTQFLKDVLATYGSKSNKVRLVGLAPLSCLVV